MANFVRGHRQLQNVIENNTPRASRWRDSRTKMSSGQDLQECQRSEDTSIQVRLPSGFGTNECTVIAGETQEEPILDTHRSNRNLSHHSTGSQIWLTTVDRRKSVHHKRRERVAWPKMEDDTACNTIDQDISIILERSSQEAKQKEGFIHFLTLFTTLVKIWHKRSKNSKAQPQ